MTVEWTSTHEIEIVDDDFEEMICGRQDKITNYFKNGSYKEYMSLLEDIVNNWTARLDDAEYYTITEEAIELIAIELHKYIMKNYNLGI